MRRRRGVDVHGWLVVDKPPGVTSGSVVSAVRRALNAAKAGHSGTLDPLACGVLPIALGEATKTVAYLMDRTKRYRFMVRWGERRDSDDAEGRIVECSDRRPAPAEIAAVLPQFEGEIEQVPPAYSAVKIEGRRAYALARAHLPVALSPRPVSIAGFRLVGIPDADHAEFEVECGKGAYMRSLARDLAATLGTCGHIARLRRTAVGPFVEEAAIPLDKVSPLGHSGALLEHVLPVEAALAGIPALTLTEAEARRLQQGQPIAVLPVARRSPQQHVFKDAVICAMAEGRPVALARIRGGEIRPVRVLNL